MAKSMRRASDAAPHFPVEMVFSDLAANVPPPCSRVLAFAGDHAGRLRVRRLRHRCSIRIRATSRCRSATIIDAQRTRRRRGEPHDDRLAGHKSSFSAFLMTHNTKVSIFTLALGMTWGVGTIIMLFYNGVTLGAIVGGLHAGRADEISAGLADAAWRHRNPRDPDRRPGGADAGAGAHRLGPTHAAPARLREVSRDIVTLIFGVGLLLVWAGFVEAFLSQYHEPVIPYDAKIAFGLVELVLLMLFLAKSGKEFRVPSSEFRVPRSDRTCFRTRNPERRTRNLNHEDQHAVHPHARRHRVFAIAGRAGDAVSGVVHRPALHRRAPDGAGHGDGLLQLVGANFAGAVSTIGYFVISIGYGIFLRMGVARPDGRQAFFRLRVVDAEGMRLQFNQIVTRNLLRFVDSLPAFYFVGGVACWLNPKCQRLGDIAANTVVIRNPRVSEPDLDQLLAGKFNSLRQFPHLAARLRQRVSPGEAAVALQALMRRDEFDPVARVELFAELAAHFRALVPFPAEATDGIADEQYSATWWM